MNSEYENKSENNNNIDFNLILAKLPPRICQRILNPPQSPQERDKNLFTVVKFLQREDFEDEEIEEILKPYPIGKEEENLKSQIKRIRQGNPSEYTLSLNFTLKFKNKLNYCPRWDKWFLWNGNYWQEDDKNQSIEYICQVLQETDMPDFRRRAATVKGVEFIIKSNSDLTSSPSDWDKNNWLLATPNGTVDLKTGLKRISYQEDKITKTTSISPQRIPIPKWFKFLLQTTQGDKDYIRYLQRVCGYCLTGITKEHSLFFFHGGGGNGKGVFLNTLTAILGELAVTAPLNMFMESKFDSHPTDMAMLRGARLVTAQEVQEGKAWNEIKIKALTGGDPISARFISKDFFTFIPNFKLLIAGNHEPQLRNVDEATKRRFNKLPFNNQPKEINKNLIDDLVSEHPGILQWMINGCLSWQEIGLSPPKIVQETTERYFSNQNSFQQFLDQECEISESNKFGETGSKLFLSWCFWAKSNRIPQGSMSSFRENLEKHGFIYSKHLPSDNNSRGFLGIRIKTEEKEDGKIKNLTTIVCDNEATIPLGQPGQ